MASALSDNNLRGFVDALAQSTYNLFSQVWIQLLELKCANSAGAVVNRHLLFLYLNTIFNFHFSPIDFFSGPKWVAIMKDEVVTTCAVCWVNCWHVERSISKSRLLLRAAVVAQLMSLVTLPAPHNFIRSGNRQKLETYFVVFLKWCQCWICCVFSCWATIFSWQW